MVHRNRVKKTELSFQFSKNMAVGGTVHFLEIPKEARKTLEVQRSFMTLHSCIAYPSACTK